jgi:hypothetical protein
MMLPRKTGKPIAFKVTEQLRQQTEALADAAGETLSDYIRKAVEMRNAQYTKTFPVPFMSQNLEAAEALFNGEHPHKQDNVKPTIPELKEKVKEMEKPRMVQYLGKK